MLTIHLNLLLRLTMSGVVPPLPLHAFIECNAQYVIMWHPMVTELAL